jgi:hypothetical protein
VCPRWKVNTLIRLVSGARMGRQRRERRPYRPMQRIRYPEIIALVEPIRKHRRCGISNRLRERCHATATANKPPRLKTNHFESGSTTALSIRETGVFDCPAPMTRLLAIPLIIVIGTSLQAKPQSCCDPSMDGQCDHSRAPRHTSEPGSPCQPVFTSCETVCLTEHNTAATFARSQQFTRNTASLVPPRTLLTPETFAAPCFAWRESCARVNSAKLFLLNCALVI